MHVIHGLEYLSHVNSRFAFREVTVRVFLNLLKKLTARQNLCDYVIPVLISEILEHFDDIRMVQLSMDSNFIL